MDLAKFKQLPIMGILRLSHPAPVEELVETIISSGLETIEIAMNSDSAVELINRAVETSKDRLMIGAGTVMNTEIMKAALDAGATFIVMPTLVEDVVKYCVKKSVPVFPGALTPQEIYNAGRAGATMVKVFPCVSLGGAAYIKEVRAPFNDIELLACGGVRSENIKAYFTSGAAAVAFGGSIFRKELLDNGDFAVIERSIKELIQSAKR